MKSGEGESQAIQALGVNTSTCRNVNGHGGLFTPSTAGTRADVAACTERHQRTGEQAQRK